MSTEAEFEEYNLSAFVDTLLDTIEKQKTQISQWRELAVLEGIALLLTIYFYV